ASRDPRAVPATATTTASTTSPRATPSAAGDPARSPRRTPTSTSRSAIGPTTTSIGSPVATPRATSRTKPVMERAWPGIDRAIGVLPWPLGLFTMDSLVIDGIDRAILAELRIDGRASWRELGERVGLGPTATADRVRRLERHGVIRGYHADIDLSVLGIGLRAITELQLEAGADHDEFEAEL